MILELSAIAQIVESVFDAMIGLRLEETSTAWFPAADRLTAAVHLSGEWNGALMLECTRRQACCLAGRFLSMAPAAAVDDVVRDVLGELANMIGGNLKSILVRGIHLSMPAVVDGEYSYRVCGSEIRDQLAFESEIGTFWVTILATEP
jgi:chemotaxis protein CheX